MKKILFFMALSVSFLFSAINVQTASKDELMCIKGIGEKKANAILKYRKSKKLKSIDELIEIKGFGKGIIANVKKSIKSVACGGKKTTKKSTPKKNTTKKSSTKKDDKKKTTTSKESSDNRKSTEKKKIEEKKSDKKSETKNAA
jgi:competence protein ComEA